MKSQPERGLSRSPLKAVKEEVKEEAPAEPERSDTLESGEVDCRWEGIEEGRDDSVASLYEHFHSRWRPDVPAEAGAPGCEFDQGKGE